MPFVDGDPQPRILLSGETAGTGASTSARHLSEMLELPIISGGRFFRALANRFERFQEERTDLSVDEAYQQFLLLYQQAFDSAGLDGVMKLLYPGIEQGADGVVLARFQGVLKAQAERTGTADPLWDYIVDQNTIVDALNKPGFVWESKLAILVLQFDELQPVILQQPAFALPYMNVLLQLSPEIAAQRIGQREQRQVDVSEVMTRKQRDFNRYGEIYHIQGKPVEHSDLAKAADTIIDTELLSPPEVAAKVVRNYLRKIQVTGFSRAAFAQPAVQLMESALTQVEET